MRVDHDHNSGHEHVPEEGRTTTDPVCNVTKHKNAQCHPRNRHGRPDRRLCQCKAKPGSKIIREPDHHAVIAEILNRAENSHPDTEFCGVPVFYKKSQRGFGRFSGFVCDKNLGLVQGVSNEVGNDSRENPDREHPPPPDHRQEHWRHNRRCQDTKLPPQTDIG
ncbi:hypothetical protein D3C86_1665470 [compost metagenome]